MRGIFKSVRFRVFKQLAHRVTHRIHCFRLLTRSRYAFSTLPTLTERRKEGKKARKKGRKEEIRKGKKKNERKEGRNEERRKEEERKERGKK